MLSSSFRFSWYFISFFSACVSGRGGVGGSFEDVSTVTAFPRTLFRVRFKMV